MVTNEEEYVRTGYICQRIKDRNFMKFETLGSRVCQRINENWIIDSIGPLPSNQRQPYILILLDSASRFLMLETVGKLN